MTTGSVFVAGLPKTLTITSQEVREALLEPISTIVDSVRVTLERCPPELSADLVDRGVLSAEDAERHPYKNVLSRNLGAKPETRVDVVELEIKPGDRVMLCSDGLSGMVTDAQMQDILQRTPELDKACGQLIDLANAAGGNDNVTCVLARYHAA